MVESRPETGIKASRWWRFPLLAESAGSKYIKTPWPKTQLRAHWCLANYAKTPQKPRPHSSRKAYQDLKLLSSLLAGPLTI
jgi:hypothetical protein